MNSKNGQGAKNTATQKKTFGYACGDIETRSSLSPEDDFKIFNEVSFNFKRLYIKDGVKFIDGFYKGKDIEELMNNEYYLIHTTKIRDKEYVFNDILFTSIYNVDFETKDITFKVIPLANEDKKEVFYSYFKKVYKEKKIESPYKEFELDESVEKEFLFKYLYESLEFETDSKLNPLKNTILDMQLGKVKSYKEIIFGALNMEKMIQDFFGFIKEQRNKKSPDIVRDIYIYHIYEYRHYYPYYQYPYYYLSSTPTWTTTTTGTPSWGNYNALTSSSTTLTGTMSGDLTMNSGVTTTGYSTALNELDATTSYYSTATTSSTSQDFSLEYEGSMDNKIDDLYSKLSKINENNL